MRIARIILIGIAIFCIMNQSFAEENDKIKGAWGKSFFEQNGNRDYDSRWKLIISFLDNNIFVCESISDQEEWLVNSKTGERKTEVIEHIFKFKGKYSFENGQYRIVFEQALTNEEKQLSAINLGYNDELKECLIKIFFEKELLVLKGVNSNRIIFFKKYNKTL